MAAAAVTTAPGADGRKVVIDAGAAIKLQRLERLGSELYTTSGVLREVKDEHARALLATLPVELKTREPLPQDLAFVKQFAKATGDFGFLSQNDMELIALTVQLHRESGGTVRDRPQMLTHGEGSTAAFDWAPARADRRPGGSVLGRSDCGSTVTGGAGIVNDAGAACGVAGAAPATSVAAVFDPPARTTGEAVCSAEVDKAAEQIAEETPAQVAAGEADEVTAAKAEPAGEAGVQATEQQQEDTQVNEEDHESDADQVANAFNSESDGSSAGEWVTPDNMHRFGVGVEPDIEVKVTCATADYSVQNVLLQMGITPLTFDGYAVRSVKMWGLVCRACFLFTRETQKVFCPKCGHDTLVRVPIVVDQDGKPTALNNGRPLRRKGTVYSCPKPQMGRGWRPVFSEDELRIGGRDRELRRLENLAGKEKASRDPFNEDNGARGWWQRGTTATGKMLTGKTPRVQAGFGRRNPNANNFRGFNKTKR